MKRILAQCIKELAQFRRDRLTVALAILLPLATLFIFGFAIRLEATNIPIVIQDLNNSSLSRSYIEQLIATNQFQATRWDNNVMNALEKGVAKAAAIIPPDFDSQIKLNKPTTIQVLIDGTDANNARVIQNSFRATTNAFLQTSGLQQQPNIVARIRLWFNPGRKESLYIVPGVYGVILWIYPSLLAAIAMVREKERGTILQVYASSLSAAELLLGKGLAYFIIGIAQAIVIISLGSLLFQLTFAVEPSIFILGTLVYLWTSVLFGLLIGVRASNQNAAVQGVATIGFLTSLLLSGFIYPLSNIPFPLSLISSILPARYYIELSRDAFVRGTGWVGVWLIPLVLIFMSLLLFNTARRGLSRMQLPS
ncbi:ABC transporter permease [Gloeocapsopsis dulcis]|uniref:ABC transporter n=1 Tax=Gloeocapsopsis dulcis AAB1 = 1H9 TaxID=1433147 RepID=A0A6N8G2J7_9CHRO|nr:ABC transporter permease [Gloeocapsopsis dulcis]MUL38396.1 ABC transporter [Gloeocapsopsis dulcis AAB1 = 1H9]WNN89182.1 ABC transporter permease [Gloeocapsopsis dulcis]